MSATAKTLGSIGLALVALVLYFSIFVGSALFKIASLGLAVYLGLALTVLLFVVVLLITTVGGGDDVTTAG
jgi:hypothetical protein